MTVSDIIPWLSVASGVLNFLLDDPHGSRRTFTAYEAVKEILLQTAAFYVLFTIMFWQGCD